MRDITSSNLRFFFPKKDILLLWLLWSGSGW